MPNYYFATYVDLTEQPDSFDSVQNKIITIPTQQYNGENEDKYILMNLIIEQLKETNSDNIRIISLSRIF